MKREKKNAKLMPVLKQTTFFLEFFLFGVTVENVYATTIIIHQECRNNDSDERRRREELDDNYHLIIHIARYDLLP